MIHRFQTLLFLIFFYLLQAQCFAISGSCLTSLLNYKIVKNSVYPFIMNNEKHCFFAFYIANPNPGIDGKGDGNIGDSVWFGYYKLNKPNQINEFPKPADDSWSNICSVNAVSFQPMYGDHKRNITIIGSCAENIRGLTFTVIFTRKNNTFVLDEHIYDSLYGFIGMSISDVRAYIKSPEKCYPIFSQRYNPNSEKFYCD